MIFQTSIQVAPTFWQLQAVVRRLGRRDIYDHHAVDIRLPLESAANRFAGVRLFPQGILCENFCMFGQARPLIVAPQLASVPPRMRESAASISGSACIDDCCIEYMAFGVESRRATRRVIRCGFRGHRRRKIPMAQDLRPANCGRLLTRPTESVRPFWRATRPSVAVAATPPRAPINQTPIRGEDIARRAGAAEVAALERSVCGEGEQALGTELGGFYDCPTGRDRASSFAPLTAAGAAANNRPSHSVPIRHVISGKAVDVRS